LSRFVGHVRSGFPDAGEPRASQESGGTGVRAGNSERGGRRRTAAGKQEDQRCRACPRSQRSQRRAPAYHGNARASLSCPSRQFAPRNLHLLAEQDRSLLRRVLDQLIERALTHLVSSG
jgi:hypothetical protein